MKLELVESVEVIAARRELIENPPEPEAAPDAVAIAKAFCAELPAKLAESIDCVYVDDDFNPQIISSLSLLKSKAPKVYQQTFDLLREYGVPYRLLMSALKEAPKLRSVEDAQAEIKTAGDWLTDAPISSLVIPRGYGLLTDATVSAGVFGNEVIAHGALLITGRTRDIDSDAEGVRVSWKRRSAWRHKIVDRAVVANANALVALAGSGFPVTSSNSKAQVEYFAKLEAENFGELPQAQTASHLGWSKNGGFLVGSEFIQPDGSSISAVLDADSMAWADKMVTFRGVSAGDDQVASAFQRTGTMKEWIEAVRKVKDFPRVMTALYAAFVPPMLSVFDCPNFIVDLCASTSKGKSTTQRIAASVWGCPDESQSASVLQMWDMTPVFVERASAVMCDLPFIVDETKRAKNAAFIAETLYKVSSGRGRGRGTVGGMAATRTWRTVMISSGEQPVTSFTNDGGTRMRVLEIADSPFEAETEANRKLVERLNMEVKANYGQAGPVFVSWLLKNRSNWGRWKAENRELAQAYVDASNTERAGRLAVYVATIAKVGSLVHQALGFDWAFEDPVESLWREMAGEADDAVGAVRALRLVMSWAHSQPFRFIGRANDRDTPSGGYLGRWDYGDDFEFVGFYPDKIRDFLISQRYEPDAIFNEWRGREWLKVSTSDSGRHFTVRTRIGKQSYAPRMVCVTRSAVDAVSGYDGSSADVVD